MTVYKSLLNSNALNIFRGYIKGILSNNNGGFSPRSTNICLYKQVADSLSNNIKDLVLHILNEELEKNTEKEFANTIYLNLIDLITDNYLYLNAPILPLESLINNEFERIINSSKDKSSNFIIIELPRYFRSRSLFFKNSANNQVEEEDGLDSDDEFCKEVTHFGVFNTTTDDASNKLEESIYRVLKRFIERTMMQENFNNHIIMLSPYFKPPQLLLGKGMFEIYLSIEWETNKSNLIQLIEDVFKGIEVENGVIEMIIASISNQNSAFSELIELCFELKHSLATKYIGRRILKGKDIDLNCKMKIRNEDAQDFLQKYNSKLLNSYYSSIDSLISTKISIDNDFVGLNELRKSIKDSINALEQFSERSEVSKNEIDTYAYPISWFLWGSSGSGKSTLVRSMVSISPKVKVLLCNVIDLISPFHGITTRNLRRIFKNAINSRPCILVFDDIETLGALTKKDDLSEGEVRSKINKELASTFLHLLDSVISIDQFGDLGNDLLQQMNTNTQERSLEEAIDHFNPKVSRKLAGIMIVMTSRNNMGDFSTELLLKVQKHSFLQLPSIKELLESIREKDNDEVSATAEEIANEIQNLQGDRLINVSEFKILVQNKLYEKYTRREANSKTSKKDP
ncbi:ATPase family associated with various cellular activities (AAA) family protein [Cryptosporidium meleagridis]|uniref:ATPase family associated with various cellular activities (AAA) family protein n=1 Tax=Cryptosporidium meleagridis TaxID=93969 RepID=A0A2P4YWJ2_9CRYT|nr:ATPase family associated with various cellular activities (AAA) family protein [Cryptosporidium meleagridis]